MVIGCSAFGCTNRQICGSRLQFHRFPLSDTALLKKWLHQVKRKNWQPTKYSFLCGEHFSEDSYISGVEIENRRLKKGAVPTNFDFQTRGKPLRKNAKKQVSDETDLGEETSSEDIAELVVFAHSSDLVVDPIDPPSPDESQPYPCVWEFPEEQLLMEKNADSAQNSANVPDSPGSSESKEPSELGDSETSVSEETMCSAIVQDVHCYAGTEKNMYTVMLENVKLKQKIKSLRQQVGRKEAKIQELKRRLKSGDYDDPEVFEFHVRATYT